MCNNKTTSSVSWSFLFILTLFLSPLITVINSAEAKTKIKHDEVDKTRVGDPIRIDALITDDSGVELARVYFKSETAKDYNFVPMKTAGERFFANLPVAAAKGRIEYLILVKNRADEVWKSKPFHIKVKKAKNNRGVVNNEKVDVFTELSEAPSTVKGFADNTTADLVESGVRYGIIAGLYDDSDQAAALLTTADATYAGVASSGGGGALALLAIGGVAAAAGGGGDDDPPVVPPVTPTTPTPTTEPDDDTPTIQNENHTGTMTENCSVISVVNPSEGESVFETVSGLTLCSGTIDIDCDISFEAMDSAPVSGSCQVSKGCLSQKLAIDETLAELDFSLDSGTSAISSEPSIPQATCSLNGELGGVVQITGCTRSHSGFLSNNGDSIELFGVETFLDYPFIFDSTLSIQCTTVDGTLR